MKIIFDSKEQKKDFIELNCPNDLLIEEHKDYCPMSGTCEDCWRKSGIELEAKDE